MFRCLLLPIFLLCCVSMAPAREGYMEATDTTGKKNRSVRAADTVNPVDLSGLEPIFENVFIYDFFTTVNALHYENAQTDEQKNELNFYYNITLNNAFKTKYFTLRSYFFNEYGAKHYFDSLTIKGQDNFQIRNVLQVRLLKALKMQIGVTGKSQLWKTYNYRLTDSAGAQSRYLFSDYFSPGYITYSCGITYSFLRNATLDIGLVGGKITKIRNQEIFDERNQKKLYGLDKGERKKASYGISLVLNVPPRRISKNIGWECNGNVYADKEQIGRLQGYSFEAMNVLHYIFLKNLRISLRTHIKYDEQVAASVYMMNMLSVGFYLSNKI